jgi:hypothetical protein
MDFDLKDMEFYHYLAIGGIALVIIAVILYFFKGGKLEMPALVTSTIGGLIAGLAFGIIILATFGYHWDPPKPGEGPINAPPGITGAGGGGGGPGPMGFAGPGGGGGRGGPGGARGGPGGGGGRGGPNSKRQLAALVDKLEVITRKSLTIELSDDDRKQIADQLKGLAEMQELSNEEAKKRLDTILEIVKKNRESLEAIGYRFPDAAAGFGPMSDTPNPFRDDHAKALETLEERLGKK